MSITRKSIIFLAITFAFSWTLTLGGHFLGWADAIDRAAGNPPTPLGGVLILLAMMAGPAVAALICTFAFEKGNRIDALGLRFKVNWWWLLAWIIPIALAALSVVATVVLSGRQFADIGESIISSMAMTSPQQAEAMRAQENFGLFTVVMALTAGALINAPILTITEELGWRGYLHHLWRPHGFWRASLATGAIWGIWHAPAILFYGLNYPSNPEIGVAMFVLWCMLLSPIMTLIRDRGGSTWAAGIAHGAINAVGGLTIAAHTNPEFPWIGFVGIGGCVALAIGVAVVFVLQQRAPAAT